MKYFKRLIEICIVFLLILTNKSANGQYHANINFLWSNIDSSIHRISLNNSSDFWWNEWKPINQFSSTRTLEVEHISWQVNLITPVQQIYVSIVGKSFKLLLSKGDVVEIKIKNKNGLLEIQIDGIEKKRILLLETIDKYQIDIGLTINEIKKKSKEMVQNYLQNEEPKFNILANHYIEARILNQIFYQNETLNMPDWVFLNDTSSIYKKLGPVTELIKNYGLSLSSLYNQNKDDSLLIQKTNILKKYYRDYALIVAIEKILTENFNSLSKENAEQLLGLIEDSTHQVYFSKILANTYLMGKSLPDSVSSQTLLLPLNSKKAISFSELLSNSTEEIVVIDFWASWCSACRLDMQEAVATKKYLDSLKIKVVYISCDRAKDREKWIQASKVEKVVKNQFLIMDDFSSPLIKYLNVNYIPRYILFKKGKLMNIVFPRLTDQSLHEVRKEVEKIIKVEG